MAAKRLAIAILLQFGVAAEANEPAIVCRSPDRRNQIELQVRGGEVRYTITRDGRVLIGPSAVGPIMANAIAKT